MAAGLGFKDFQTGEVLTAADVDSYLMQGIWVFASAAARDAAVTSPQEGNFAYLKDTNVTTYYTGSAWANLDTTGMTNPMTTTGDTIYSSSGSTPARLGIGSTGQVLTVAGGIPSWATPAGGASGLTLIQRSTFSNVAGTSTTFDGVFTSTYKSYLVVLEYVYGASATNDLQLQGIYSGTTSTANYVGSSGFATYNSASFSNIQNNVTSQFTMTENVGTNQSAAVTGQLFFTNVGNSSVNGRISGQLYDGQSDNNHFLGCNLETRLYTGFLLKSSSSNITGIVAVYGLAAA
jgi:hypothetical protein